ncbi:MAG: DUF1553 domain-containing protein, partial [Verrucomicrobia bacterium]|nr:DUF1553 domain-containing protein [Verrucomicrobiota bacterium]
AMASAPSPAARERDSNNELLSHFRVQRLEAESIRDALLAVSGRLDATPFGPGVPLGDRARRSVYLTIRRTNLSPFLEVFDAPKPFTTLGRRDVTNVPAQSLALLNDPFVIEMARALAAAYLADLAREHNAAEHFATNENVWRDFAQSLFNLKEFIYIR